MVAPNGPSWPMTGTSNIDLHQYDLFILITLH